MKKLIEKIISLLIAGAMLAGTGFTPTPDPDPNYEDTVPGIEINYDNDGKSESGINPLCDEDETEFSN